VTALARRSPPLLTATALVTMLLAGSAGATSSHRHSHRHASAHAAIVGGSPIPISQVPWQVSVQASIPEGLTRLRLRCGGTILDDFHILTAAHCTFDPKTDQRIAPEDFLVRAGTADLTSSEPGEQTREVTTVRAHPYYIYASTDTRLSTDDVAVLTLAEPLTFSGVVSPIALATVGSLPPEGATTALAGFGEQTPGTEADGHLYGLQMDLISPRECGGENNAVVVCASSPSGSPCSGDSGSGLILSGNPLTLIGVMDSGQVIAGKRCAAGERATFANVAAGEIQDFIDGSETPPKAPRGEGVSCTVDGSEVGDAMTCLPGAWSEAPTFTFTFMSGQDGHVLQSGSSDTYRFTEADVGSTVMVQLNATNAGGTAIDRTQLTQAISAARRGLSSGAPGVRIVSTVLSVKRNAVFLKLRCVGGSACRGTILLRVRSRARGARTVTLARANFAIESRSSRALELTLVRGSLSLIKTDGGHLTAKAVIRERSPAPGWTHIERVRLRAVAAWS
jgi:trypsin